MSECVDSRHSLLASIRITLYLCRLGNRDVWERGKNRALVQQRGGGGRRGKEEEEEEEEEREGGCCLSVKAVSASFTSKRLGGERDITHSGSWGQSQRPGGGRPGVSGDLGGKCGTLSQMK